jgi:hypothetical protein
MGVNIAVSRQVPVKLRGSLKRPLKTNMIAKRSTRSVCAAPDVSACTAGTVSAKSGEIGFSLGVQQGERTTPDTQLMPEQFAYHGQA